MSKKRDDEQAARIKAKANSMVSRTGKCPRDKNGWAPREGGMCPSPETQCPYGLRVACWESYYIRSSFDG